MKILIAENDKHVRENIELNDDLPLENSRSYFINAYALPEYRLKVMMGTGATIDFNFKYRLDTMRFGALRDEEMFQSVRTDGNCLIFEKNGKIPIKITASEFMNLVLVDRRR